MSRMIAKKRRGRHVLRAGVEPEGSRRDQGLGMRDMGLSSLVTRIVAFQLAGMRGTQ